jgi:hypothetical protein
MVNCGLDGEVPTIESHSVFMADRDKYKCRERKLVECAMKESLDGSQRWQVKREKVAE